MATPPLPTLDPLIAATVDELERRVRESGDTITADRRVSPLVAAALLGCSAGTLRNWRAAGDGPAFIRLGVAEGGRVSYKLVDLAEHMHTLRAARH